MKLLSLMFTLLLIGTASEAFVSQVGYGSENSCEVGPRNVRCRNMNNTPTTDELVEINGCRVSCRENLTPVCLPGYLSGTNCNDWAEASRCYCS